MRRAVAHVDTPTAHDIAAYIRTIRAPAMGRDFRIFQPGGERLSSDVEFALRLFGADAWPEEMGPGELAAIDPARVPVALDLPLWSEESSNLDWMPEVPISTALLDHAGEVGPARPHLESYYRTRRLDDLLRAAVALRVAERDPANPAAPCVLEPPGRLRSEACFEARRWLSSLVAQHMLREGIERPLHPALHGAWWDVGDAARRSRFTDRPIENAERNWAVWMWLGWAFAPDRHASVYLGNALLRLGLPRHATFHALRALVARGPRGLAPFRDVRNAARFAPPHWAFAATRFGYQHLIRRLEAGSRPPGAAIGEAREDVLAAYAAAARKAPAGRLAELAALRDRVLAYLD